MPLSTIALQEGTPQDAFRRPRGRRRREEALDPTTVAELSARQITRMTRHELVRVVRSARTPAAQRRLEYYDHATLQRLAYQARLCCQRRNR